MIVLLPMGGLGSRFRNAGYHQNKPSIPVTDRKTGDKVPMVIAALRDIPNIYNDDTKIVCVNRDFHAHDGTEEILRCEFKNIVFIHDHVLLDQAVACLLAREYLATDDELFIASCDNGADFPLEEFSKKKESCDALLISHSNDDNIARDPFSHSWVKLDKNENWIEGISVKKPLNDNFMKDHATTGMFWFRHANIFLRSLEIFLSKDGTLLEKNVVDAVIQTCLEGGFKISYLDVRFFCWGTPEEYEIYERTINYWTDYINENKWFNV